MEVKDFHGLPNFGNTCWFNAIFQLLKSLATQERSVQDLVDNFDGFYDHPTRKCVEWVCNQLNVRFGEQQDAEEMLCKIFCTFKCDVVIGYDHSARLQHIPLGTCKETLAEAVLMFGGQSRGGHWTAARKLNGEWYVFDDSIVIKKNPDWSRVTLVLRSSGLCKASDFKVSQTQHHSDLPQPSHVPTSQNTMESTEEQSIPNAGAVNSYPHKRSEGAECIFNNANKSPSVKCTSLQQTDAEFIHLLATRISSLFDDVPTQHHR